MNNEDYIISFRINEKEKFIYLPCKDNYKVIAEAVRKVCHLFDNKLSTNCDISTEKKSNTIEKEGNVLMVCDENELVEMVKYHNSYWIEPKKLELRHILDPKEAIKFQEKAKSVYIQLMSRISHR